MQAQAPMHLQCVQVSACLRLSYQLVYTKWMPNNKYRPQKDHTKKKNVK